jgi:hypothetical protein
MTEEIKNSNQLETIDTQAEVTDTRLPYEPPKLHKHGKIHDLTLTVPMGALPDSAVSIGIAVFDIS